MNSKKYILSVFFLLFISLFAVAIPIIYVDPFIHYHKPIKGQMYPVWELWYVNHGVMKNFDYETLITGTSTTDNFKASEAAEFFGGDCVKVPFDGGSFLEIDTGVKYACRKNENLKRVIRGLDPVNIFDSSDMIAYPDKPEFMYDDIVINDIPYLLDKEILINAVRAGFVQPPITFDEYLSWNDIYTYSPNDVLSRYARPEKREKPITYSDENIAEFKENIEKNIIQTAKDNPDIEFHYYITPFSIVYFDRENQIGRLEYNFDVWQMAVEMMLEVENIKIYSFLDRYDITCDLNKYKDFIHFHESVNSEILRCINQSSGLLTKENYKEHFRQIKQFYTNYDYESLFV